MADQKAAKWTWLDDYEWPATKAFVACNFAMKEPDQEVRSAAAGTYNASDKGYWRYGMFDSDGSEAEPLIARITIKGDMWTAYGKSDNKTCRAIYRYIYARDGDG